MHHNHRRNPLEIGELAEFDKNIAGENDTEKKRKRVAYLQQAMEQFGHGKSAIKAMGCFLIPFLIIPLFWPMLLVMYIVMRKSLRLYDRQIEGALQYWGLARQDIGLE